MDQFSDYLDGERARLSGQESKLAAAQRKDEANLLRIEGNVYEICKTVYQVTQRGAQPGQLRQAYLQKLSDLPKNWREAREKAEKNGDTTRVVIEDVKLEALERIREAFLRKAESV